MRLLSFLSDIERAVIAESPAVDGGVWESSRMVNFHNGLARLTLTPKPTTDIPLVQGTIFLQAFALADGSQCLKATLSWKDSNAARTIAVYSTPNSNWKLEASRIAAQWLEGPPPEAIVEPVAAETGLAPLTVPAEPIADGTLSATG
jgi:hypothetical protein